MVTKDFLTLQIKRRDETLKKEKEKIKCNKNRRVIRNET